MSAPPYMPLYIGEYHADTTHLVRGEHGAYFLLLMAMWRAGGKLPGDDLRLARLALCTPAEWAKMKPVILEFFTRRGAVITHKRVRSELTKYETKIVSARAGGKSTASKNIRDINGKFSNSLGVVLEPKTSQPEPEPELDKSKKENPSDSTKKVVKLGSRLPPDWRPGPEETAYAKKHHIPDLDRTAERFRNYWTAKSGTQATKLDWPATWRNWVLNESERFPTTGAKEVDWC